MTDDDIDWDTPTDEEKGMAASLGNTVAFAYQKFQADHNEEIIDRVNKIKDALFQPGKRPEIDYGPMPERLTFGRAATTTVPTTAASTMPAHLVPEMSESKDSFASPQSSSSSQASDHQDFAVLPWSPLESELNQKLSLTSSQEQESESLSESDGSSSHYSESIQAVTRSRRHIFPPARAQAVPTVMMPRQEALPRMAYYLPTELNVVCEDQKTLGHLPFESHLPNKSAAESFVREFKDCFDHAHGITETVDYDHLDDRLLSSEYYPDVILALWRALEQLEVPGVEPLRPFEGRYTAQEPPYILFHVLRIVFPDYGSAGQHYDRYSDILQKKNIKPEKYIFPDIDGENAVSATVEEALHSYLSIYCARCGVYDCHLHWARERPGCRGAPKKPGTVPEEEGPCSDCCYKLDYAFAKVFLVRQAAPAEAADHGNAKNAIRAKDGRRRRAIVRPAIQNEVADQPGVALQPALGAGQGQLTECLPKQGDRLLTPKEETLVRCLFPIFRPNICIIAKNILTEPPPTCREVFLFIVSEMRKGKSLEDPMLIGDNVPPPTRTKGRSTVNAQLNFFSKVHAQKNAEGRLKWPARYIPCKHLGPCGEGVPGCSCGATQDYCEKFCTCSLDCKLRYKGCTCNSGCQTAACACFAGGRECDPDVCLGCDTGEVDPKQNTHNCKNNCIQRRAKHQLYVAPSEVSGWGAFASNKIAKNELVAEYCGERISHDEAERRGKVYDFDKVSFLFNLDNESVIDATNKGNHIRFANHSIDPNLGSHVKFVNGDRRIGLYANRDIDKDEELFFDYRYGSEELRFVSRERSGVKKRKPAPRTKRSKQNDKPNKNKRKKGGAGRKPKAAAATSGKNSAEVVSLLSDEDLEAEVPDVEIIDDNDGCLLEIESFN